MNSCHDKSLHFPCAVRSLPDLTIEQNRGRHPGLTVSPAFFRPLQEPVPG